ncbi:F-box/kelch-repeat protein At3g06240-like [Corylus avellana]|uniref:F-box/kelch-repeat protein At3g06240-like n=1 Tax=Corylus avellana TaxID=13451 RepID=UPI00286C5AD7|nr:F-box/kelch-repeat protein At3g06240-like [Corylus avellana]
MDDRQESLILWNPAIRMSLTLPRPSIFVWAGIVYRAYGFDFDHKSNDYKVLRIVYEPHAPLELYDLYKLCTGTWETARVADDFKHTIYPYKEAFVNGAIHWFGNHERDRASSCPERVVVLFHMCDEEFRVMKFPDHLISSLKENYVDIWVYDGLLSLMEHNELQYIESLLL